MIMRASAVFTIVVLVASSSVEAFADVTSARSLTNTRHDHRNNDRVKSSLCVNDDSNHHHHRLVQMIRGGGVSSLRASSVSQGSSTTPSVDWKALFKYTVSLAVQISLLFGVMTGIDTIVAKLSRKIPVWANGILFYAFNLKTTSYFSLLPSTRSMDTSEWEYQKRNKPNWTPPGWVFAVMWPLFVFGTRAATAALLVQKTGTYAHGAIISLLFHLCIGSLWNTVYVRLLLLFVV